MSSCSQHSVFSSPSRGPLELYHLMSSWPPVTLHSIRALDPSLTTMCLLEETLKDAVSASDPFWAPSAVQPPTRRTVRSRCDRRCLRAEDIAKRSSRGSSRSDETNLQNRNSQRLWLMQQHRTVKTSLHLMVLPIYDESLQSSVFWHTHINPRDLPLTSITF